MLKIRPRTPIIIITCWRPWCWLTPWTSPSSSNEVLQVLHAMVRHMHLLLLLRTMVIIRVIRTSCNNQCKPQRLSHAQQQQQRQRSSSSQAQASSSRASSSQASSSLRQPSSSSLRQPSSSSQQQQRPLFRNQAELASRRHLLHVPPATALQATTGPRVTTTTIIQMIKVWSKPWSSAVWHRAPSILSLPWLSVTTRMLPRPTLSWTRPWVARWAL